MPVWQTTDETLAVDSQSIHIWRVSLLVDAADESELFQLLTADEQKRAQRFLFDKHRRRFTAGRAKMRRLLAGYLHCEPLDIQFQYTNLGKPSIADTRLSFNFTNSNDLALLAATQDLELGIDTEELREMSDMEGLAKRFFHPDEIATIMAANDSLVRRSQFFRCWTRKEAVLKATGKGLTHPLDQLCVTVNEPAKMVSLDGETTEAASWSLEHFDPQEDYVASVAYRAERRELMFLQR